ncbi:MAG: hypothetical protein ACNA8L_06965 [Luteolibacter sp.]
MKNLNICLIVLVCLFCLPVTAFGNAEKIAAGVQSRIEANPEQTVAIVRAQVTATPTYAALIVRVAIETSEADEELLLAIIEAAIEAAPDMAEDIIRAAIAAAPDAVAAIQALVDRLGLSIDVQSIADILAQGDPLDPAGGAQGLSSGALNDGDTDASELFDMFSSGGQGFFNFSPPVTPPVETPVNP